MYSDTNTTRSVADAVMKIMNEKLHPNQQKLDVHEPEKDELTAKDFEMLRAGKKAKEVKKEEVEQIDEISTKTLASAAHAASDPDSDYYYGKSHDPQKFAAHAKKTKDAKSATAVQGAADAKGHYPRAGHTYGSDKLAQRQPPRVTISGKANKQDIKSLKSSLQKEEEQVEPILEYETDKNGRYVHNAKAGKYGGSEKPQDPFAGVRGPGQKDLEKIEAEKKKKKKFSEMIDLYNEKGLKSLSEMLVKEEPDNEQFTKELEDAKAKSEGKKPNKEIAKGSVQAVKSEEVETELEVIEEREMTSAEMEKRETIVKSMKKGMAGFKERYGDRAKNVMYATATKQAMKD